MQETAEDRSETDRRCPHPGCRTVLSTYNVDFLCFSHADEKTRTLFERVTDTSRSRRTIYSQRNEAQTSAL